MSNQLFLEMWCFLLFFFNRTDKTVIGCSGFHGDCLTLTKIIEARLKVDAFVHVYTDES